MYYTLGLTYIYIVSKTPWCSERVSGLGYEASRDAGSKTERTFHSMTSSASLSSSAALSARRLNALTFLARSLSGLQSANRNALLHPDAGHLVCAVRPFKLQ